MLLALTQVQITFHDMCTCVSANNMSSYLHLRKSEYISQKVTLRTGYTYLKPKLELLDTRHSIYERADAPT